MRILHVAPIANEASGITSVVLAISKRLASRGHTVGVVSPASLDERLRDSFARFGVRIHGPIKLKDNFTCLTRGQAIEWTKVCYDYDIIHLHGVFNPTSQLFVKYCYENARRPFVVSPHGNLMPAALRYHRVRKKIYLEVFARSILQRAAYIHVLGEEEAVAVRRFLPTARVEVIPNGIDTEGIIDASSHTNVRDCVAGEASSNPGFRIVFIGRLDVHHKGIDLLLQAIKHSYVTLKECKVEVELVGPFQSDRDRRIVTQLMDDELRSIVRLSGPKYGTERDKVLRSCDVFIHTSRYEGMPMAVLEAMAAGKPCIVTPGTNMAEIIESAKAGFSCECRVESIADVLVRASRTPRDELLSMGANARRLCLEYYNWDSIAGQYERLYKQAVNEAR